MTQHEIIERLSAAPGNDALVAAVRAGEYAVWCRGDALLAESDDERLTLEVLLWALDRIIGDLEEHGPEQADLLYEGLAPAVFSDARRDLEGRAGQMAPTSEVGRALAAERRGLTPRERFIAAQKVLSQARRDGSASRFAVALAEIGASPRDLVASWIDNLLMEVMLVFVEAIEHGTVPSCEPVVRALVAFSEGPHGELLRRGLKRATGRNLARFTDQVAEATGDRELAVRLRALMA
ncbi:MAG: hypothetical protein KC613_22995 [Myxococcales bacterium]|nr:hypothetical protein [Myxococcales bacterium]